MENERKKRAFIAICIIIIVIEQQTRNWKNVTWFKQRSIYFQSIFLKSVYGAGLFSMVSMSLVLLTVFFFIVAFIILLQLNGKKCVCLLVFFVFVDQLDWRVGKSRKRKRESNGKLCVFVCMRFFLLRSRISIQTIMQYNCKLRNKFQCYGYRFFFLFFLFFLLSIQTMCHGISIVMA